MKGTTHFGIVVTLVMLLGAVDFAHTKQLKVGKTGHITLAQETTVGNAVLPPGKYEVRQRSTRSGHYMEFTRVTLNYFRNDGEYPVPVDDEVVAKVPCTIESVNSIADKTEAKITPSTDGMRLASLEIRGENVIHLFPAGPAAPVAQSRTASM